MALPASRMIDALSLWFLDDVVDVGQERAVRLQLFELSCVVPSAGAATHGSPSKVGSTP